MGDRFLRISAGDVATRNFALLRKKFASLSGTVTDAITGLPIEGATGGATHKLPSATTGGQGTYSQSNIDIGYRNDSLQGAVSFSADGYWPAQVSATFEANKETIADLELIPICEGATIRGRVVDATTQQPLEGATVSVVGNSSDLTGPDGTYVISGIRVGTNNSPISATVFASKEGYFTQSKTITVFCGASISINFGPPPPLGALEGFVTNSVTGDPITDVLIVGEFGEETRTDADGHYLFEEVPVNDDGSPKTWNVTALPSGFTLQTKPVTIRVNETARLDFQFGGVEPPETGKIIVKVVTQPANGSQSFSFTPSYGSTFSLTNGQSNDSGPLEPEDIQRLADRAIRLGHDLELRPGRDTRVDRPRRQHDRDLHVHERPARVDRDQQDGRRWRWHVRVHKPEARELLDRDLGGERLEVLPGTRARRFHRGRDGSGRLGPCECDVHARQRADCDHSSAGSDHHLHLRQQQAWNGLGDEDRQRQRTVGHARVRLRASPRGVHDCCRDPPRVRLCNRRKRWIGVVHADSRRGGALPAVRGRHARLEDLPRTEPVHAFQRQRGQQHVVCRLHRPARPGTNPDRR